VKMYETARVRAGLRRCVLAVALFGTAAVSLPVMTPTVAAYVPYEGAIRDAAARHAVSADWMISVMMCESGGDPYAVNPVTGDSGLFQYNPSTWSSWGGGDIWDPYAQIEKTAWAFSQGLSYHWVCA
jgi:hypothetical protein